MISAIKIRFLVFHLHVQKVKCSLYGMQLWTRKKLRVRWKTSMQSELLLIKLKDFHLIWNLIRSAKFVCNFWVNDWHFCQELCINLNDFNCFVRFRKWYVSFTWECRQTTARRRKIKQLCENYSNVRHGSAYSGWMCMIKMSKMNAILWWVCLQTPRTHTYCAEKMAVWMDFGENWMKLRTL